MEEKKIRRYEEIELTDEDRKIVEEANRKALTDVLQSYVPDGVLGEWLPRLSQNGALVAMRREVS